MKPTKKKTESVPDTAPGDEQSPMSVPVPQAPFTESAGGAMPGGEAVVTSQTPFVAPVATAMAPPQPALPTAPNAWQAPARAPVATPTQMQPAQNPMFHAQPAWPQPNVGPEPVAPMQPVYHMPQPPAPAGYMQPEHPQASYMPPLVGTQAFMPVAPGAPGGRTPLGQGVASFDDNDDGFFGEEGDAYLPKLVEFYVPNDSVVSAKLIKARAKAKFHRQQDKPRYVLCPGDDCPLCELGKPLEEHFIFPVFDFKSNTIQALLVEGIDGVATLKSQLQRVVGDPAVETLTLAIQRSNWKRYVVTPKNPTAQPPMFARARDEFLRGDVVAQLLSAFPQPTASELRAKPEIQAELIANGLLDYDAGPDLFA